MSVDQYRVLGNPIAHSKSPEIHQKFAEQTGESIEYQRQLVELDEFPQAIRALQQQGVKGANVTVPFKEDAWRIADNLTQRARDAGAVNTLSFHDDGKITGDNTDGAGLVRDLMNNHNVMLKDKRILILGAGGAVRGVLSPLIEQQPAVLHIANRTVKNAAALADLFKSHYEINVSGFSELAGQKFDVIINGTSLGLKGEVAPLPDNILVGDAVAYDMMYGEGSRPFQQWALAQGAQAAYDGLGMLVEQAAESFTVWRGIQPDTKSVISQLSGS